MVCLRLEKLNHCVTVHCLILARVQKMAICEKKVKLSGFFGISGESLARPRAAQWALRDATRRGWTWDTIKKYTKRFFLKMSFFRWKKYFRTFSKNRKIQKVMFFEKIIKKSLFRKCSVFPEKSDFLKFSIFLMFSKIFFSSKKWKISDFFMFLFFYRISCSISASGIAQLPLCRPWAR